MAKTNPADHPSPLDPAADTSKTIGYADVTNLNIPSGTKSLLLELYSPRTFGVALSEIQAFPAVSIDYGDALASYGAPCHSITSQLYLGTVPPDGESGLQDTANAQGDDLNNTDDEDGIATLPPLPILTGSYSLPVAVTNTSGSAATLYGWIDFNGNGSFEPAEVQTASVLGDGSVTSVTLTWPTVSVASGATIYARLRFTTSSLSSAQGPASDGEVEDYLVPVTPPGSIVVVKNAVGGDDSFSFTSTGLTPTSFTLTTVGGTAQRTFPNLAPGTYSVSETVPAGWDLTSATCSDNSNPASIDLAAGENVTCTFANARQGTIIVVKRALGEDRAFSFVSASLGNFDLTTVNGEVQRTFSNLSPGTHDVSETVPLGWELSGGDPTCSDGSPASSINLGAGETVLCVFINLQDDTVVIEARTTGGDGSFPFTSGTLTPPSFTLTTTGGTTQRAFANLPPGTYDVNATVPAGWNLSSATCDNGDPPDRISMAPNQTVRCTFVYQITIAADIPTLSEWGLLLLGVLLAFNLWWRGPGRLAGRR